MYFRLFKPGEYLADVQIFDLINTNCVGSIKFLECRDYLVRRLRTKIKDKDKWALLQKADVRIEIHEAAPNKEGKGHQARYD